MTHYAYIINENTESLNYLFITNSGEAGIKHRQSDFRILQTLGYKAPYDRC